MPGFDNDPMYDHNLGYRSGLLQSGVKSYNGYVFPPCLKSQITVVPEYDDAGRTTKYLTVAITLEFILTDSTIAANEDPGSDTFRSAIMHQNVNTLLKRLCQPCQSLIFTASGFGDFKVNSSGGVTDVDFGPKPQVIEYEMLGGSQAAKVTWLCVTRIPPCPGEAVGPLVQFSYSSSWTLDNAGFMTRTIEGSAEMPLTRASQNGSQHASDRVPFPQDKLDLVQKKILNAFPRNQRFKRQVSFSFRPNKKTITFKIEDVEIQSNLAYFPGASNIEISQNMSSSLEDGGFLHWKIVYSGTIEAVNGKGPSFGQVSYGKALAWLWLGKFLQQKRQLFEDTVNAAAVNTNIPVPKQNEDIADVITNEIYSWAPKTEASGYNGGAVIYPIHISITDNLYGSSLQFTIAYAAIVTTSLLAKATGLFQPIHNIQGLKGDSWVKYISDAKVDNLSTHIAESSDLIVDLCHGVNAPSTTEPTTNITEKLKTEPITSVTAPQEGKDWIDYKCDFRFIQDHQNIISTKLHADTTNTQDTYTEQQMTDINKEMSNFPYTGTFPTLSSGDVGDKRVETKVYSPNPSVCYVEMKGYAIRLNGKINPPVLLGVGDGIGWLASKGVVIDPAKGGALAHQYGEDKVVHSVERTGLKDTNGNEVVRHYCSWTRTYVLDRKPASGKVTTTGLPHRFKQDLK